MCGTPKGHWINNGHSGPVDEIDGAQDDELPQQFGELRRFYRKIG